MVNKQAVFKYKTNKGPLHKIPAIIKLILLLPLSIICMYLPSPWLIAGITIMIITASLCRFTLTEQLTDLKPPMFYIILLYSLSIISNLTEIITTHGLTFFIAHCSLLTIFTPHPDFLHLILRLILIVQLSALVFRTTSSLEIRNVIRLEVLSLFICFIPEIFTLWSNINLAWKARGGKNGIQKIYKLGFSLLSLSFEKAAIKSKALAARK